MDDGVFCEFAVFEPHELAPIPFAPGRWVWRRDELDPTLGERASRCQRRPCPARTGW